MENYYYTIFRKDYPHDIDLSEEEECFIFDTEKQAKECLKAIFNNGEYMDDERYGRVRYYVEKVKCKPCNIWEDVCYDVCYCSSYLD